MTSRYPMSSSNQFINLASIPENVDESTLEEIERQLAERAEQTRLAKLRLRNKQSREYMKRHEELQKRIDEEDVSISENRNARSHMWDHLQQARETKTQLAELDMEHQKHVWDVERDHEVEVALLSKLQLDSLRQERESIERNMQRVRAQLDAIREVDEEQASAFDTVFQSMVDKSSIIRKEIFEKNGEELDHDMFRRLEDYMIGRQIRAVGKPEQDAAAAAEPEVHMNPLEEIRKRRMDKLEEQKRVIMAKVAELEQKKKALEEQRLDLNPASQSGTGKSHHDYIQYAKELITPLETKIHKEREILERERTVASLQAELTRDIPPLDGYRYDGIDLEEMMKSLIFEWIDAIQFDVSPSVASQVLQDSSASNNGVSQLLHGMGVALQVNIASPDKMQHRLEALMDEKRVLENELLRQSTASGIHEAASRIMAELMTELATSVSKEMLHVSHTIYDVGIDCILRGVSPPFLSASSLPNASHLPLPLSSRTVYFHEANNPSSAAVVVPNRQRLHSLFEYLRMQPYTKGLEIEINDQSTGQATAESIAVSISSASSALSAVVAAPPPGPFFVSSASSSNPSSIPPPKPPQNPFLVSPLIAAAAANSKSLKQQQQQNVNENGHNNRESSTSRLVFELQPCSYDEWQTRQRSDTEKLRKELISFISSRNGNTGNNSNNGKQSSASSSSSSATYLQLQQQMQSIQSAVHVSQFLSSSVLPSASAFLPLPSLPPSIVERVTLSSVSSSTTTASVKEKLLPLPRVFCNGLSHDDLQYMATEKRFWESGKLSFSLRSVSASVPNPLSVPPAAVTGAGSSSSAPSAPVSGSSSALAIGGLTCCSFSPDGRFLAAGSVEGVVAIWQLRQAGPLLIRKTNPIVPPSSSSSSASSGPSTGGVASRVSKIVWSIDSYHFLVVLDSGLVALFALPASLQDSISSPAAAAALSSSSPSLPLPAPNNSSSFLSRKSGNSSNQRQSVQPSADDIDEAADDAFLERIYTCNPVPPSCLALITNSPHNHFLLPFELPVWTSPEHRVIMGGSPGGASLPYATNVCFHSGFTIAGTQPCLILGSSRGRIIRLSMLPAASKLLFGSPVVSPLSSSNKHEDATSATIHPPSLPCLKETYQYHKYPILFTGFICNGLRMVSVDSSGVICFWDTDDKSSLSPIVQSGTLEPRSVFRLQLIEQENTRWKAKQWEAAVEDKGEDRSTVTRQFEDMVRPLTGTHNIMTRYCKTPRVSTFVLTPKDYNHQQQQLQQQLQYPMEAYSIDQSGQVIARFFTKEAERHPSASSSSLHLLDCCMDRPCKNVFILTYSTQEQSYVVLQFDCLRECIVDRRLTVPIAVALSSSSSSSSSDPSAVSSSSPSASTIIPKAQIACGPLLQQTGSDHLFIFMYNSTISVLSIQTGTEVYRVSNSVPSLASASLLTADYNNNPRFHLAVCSHDQSMLAACSQSSNSVSVLDFKDRSASLSTSPLLKQNIQDALSTSLFHNAATSVTKLNPNPFGLPQPRIEVCPAEFAVTGKRLYKFRDPSMIAGIGKSGEDISARNSRAPTPLAQPSEFLRPF